MNFVFSHASLHYQCQIAAPGEEDPNGMPIGMSLHSLGKSYKDKSTPAVQDLSVSLFQGQVTALLGHNGAGKSSTM